MGFLASLPEQRRCIIFLNISFVLVATCFLIIYTHSGKFLLVTKYNSFSSSSQTGCKGLQNLDDYKAKCFYLESDSSCVSQGYFDYLYLFYCNFGRCPLLGYFLLFLWLLVLFYLLGNTASEYFCFSLESLSSLLKLSPTVAGVTLLSLGNGAPDVFASFVSLMGKETLNLGLNTVLGGSSFVTCVVVGTIGILMHRKHVQIDKHAFVRDVCFFLLVLASLLLILIHGKINIWEAMAFSSMYMVFVIIVYITSTRSRNSEGDVNSNWGDDLGLPILNGIQKAELDYLVERHVEDETIEVKHCCFCFRISASCDRLIWFLELPLSLPRRLTIPVVSEKRWSKPTAVASVTFAPILLSALFYHQYDKVTPSTGLITYGIGCLIGIISGILAYLKTEKSSPPKKCLLPWLAGGFLMSVVWSYIAAQELVALLVSLGYICGISPSILGLTVLAWGNSLGDLITNLAMALNGGPEGAQVAISGCYAGPIFNTLFGLGLSLVGSSWYAFPSSVLIPSDPYLLETLGFLAAGLLWALLVLPWRGMRLDGILGGGLLLIYLLSMSLRLMQSHGPLQLVHT